MAWGLASKGHCGEQEQSEEAGELGESSPANTQASRVISSPLLWPKQCLQELHSSRRPDKCELWQSSGTKSSVAAAVTFRGGAGKVGSGA